MSFQFGASTAKIDNARTDGLAGANNSLAYRVHEIERHFHSYESWFGAANVPSGETHVADRIGTTVTPFTIDAGNNTWGAWTQILGSDDTPARTGNVKFDMHRIGITNIERNAQIHFFQFAFGDSGAGAFADGEYTEIAFEPPSSGVEEAPIDIQMRRKSVGTKVWARVFVPSQDTGNASFFVGVHEYEG